MTDEEAQVFVRLKFSNMLDVVSAFMEAIGAPRDHRTGQSNTNVIREGVKKWIAQGCPERLCMTSEDVDFFIKLKYGSIRDAYYYWVNTPPGTQHNLSEEELIRIIDFIPELPDKFDK